MKVYLPRELSPENSFFKLKTKKKYQIFENVT
jgi:hypothetical protein